MRQAGGVHERLAIVQGHGRPERDAVGRKGDAAGGRNVRFRVERVDEGPKCDRLLRQRGIRSSRHRGHGGHGRHHLETDLIGHAFIYPHRAARRRGAAQENGGGIEGAGFGPGIMEELITAVAQGAGAQHSNRHDLVIHRQVASHPDQVVGAAAHGRRVGQLENGERAARQGQVAQEGKGSQAVARFKTAPHLDGDVAAHAAAALECLVGKAAQLEPARDHGHLQRRAVRHRDDRAVGDRRRIGQGERAAVDDGVSAVGAGAGAGQAQ